MGSGSGLVEGPDLPPSSMLFLSSPDQPFFSGALQERFLQK